MKNVYLKLTSVSTQNPSEPRKKDINRKKKEKKDSEIINVKNDSNTKKI